MYSETETDVIRQPEEAPRRSIGSVVVAMALTAVSFLATVGALGMPAVEGAIARHPKVAPEERYERHPMPSYAPIVRAAQPMLPTIHVTSRPSGAQVVDSRGEVIGKTPLLVRAPNGAPSEELLITSKGFQDKRVLVTFNNQTLLAVMAHSVTRR
jgi:hypothetical protein